MATQAALVSDRQRAQFRDEGYFVLESVLSREDLQMLRDHSQRAIDDVDKRMDAAGSDVDGLNHRGKRYFLSNMHLSDPDLREFLHSELMASVAQAALGDNVWHFFNQYVVKMAEVGMKFDWHQDSGYLLNFKTSPHLPYLSCWCPLDDIDEENGTIYVLPFSRAGTTGITQHRHDAGSNDMVGYTGGDPGDPVVVPAGSIVAFSSLLLHRSGPNRTDSPRRVFLAQYSAEAVMRDDDPAMPVFNADPVLRDGVRVSRGST